MGTNKQSPEQLYSLHYCSTYYASVYWDSRIMGTNRSPFDVRCVSQLSGFDCTYNNIICVVISVANKCGGHWLYDAFCLSIRFVSLNDVVNIVFKNNKTKGNRYYNLQCVWAFGSVVRLSCLYHYIVIVQPSLTFE